MGERVGGCWPRHRWCPLKCSEGRISKRGPYRGILPGTLWRANDLSSPKTLSLWGSCENWGSYARNSGGVPKSVVCNFPFPWMCLPNGLSWGFFAPRLKQFNWRLINWALINGGRPPNKDVALIQRAFIGTRSASGRFSNEIYIKQPGKRSIKANALHYKAESSIKLFPDKNAAGNGLSHKYGESLAAKGDFFKTVATSAALIGSGTFMKYLWSSGGVLRRLCIGKLANIAEECPGCGKTAGKWRKCPQEINPAPYHLSLRLISPGRKMEMPEIWSCDRAAIQFLIVSLLLVSSWLFQKFAKIPQI